MNKYDALSMYPMGRYKCKPTNCSYVGFFLGMRNNTDGLYSRQT